ncbi:MAG: putative rRNA maturation factor [Oceanicoccus sp.]|jgi:probable rRNA maturation factor
MQLIFLNQSNKEISREIFKEVLEGVSTHLPEATHKDVELLLTNNDEIQKLNKEYRNLDKATDVLSFGYEDPEHLGQVVISVERAEEQAEGIGNTLEEELKFLFCHGVLHNLGYDHETPKEEKEMLKKTYMVLGRKA